MKLKIKWLCENNSAYIPTPGIMIDWINHTYDYSITDYKICKRNYIELTLSKEDAFTITMIHGTEWELYAMARWEMVHGKS